MSYWLRSLRFFASALSSASSPRQLALGFSMGMVIGLVPKENLTAVILLFILAGSKVNLCSASLGTILFSWLAVFIDPLSHQIGSVVLSTSSLQGFWQSVYEVPFAPWTDFNNTIVMGSLISGLFLFYPVFRISKPQFEKYSPVVAEKLKKYRIVQLLWGTQVGAIVGDVS